MLVMMMALLSYRYADLPVAIYFQHSKGDAFYEFFHFITKFGQIEYFLVPAALFYLYYKKTDFHRASQAAFVFLSLAVSGIIVLIIKMLGGRFRPERYFETESFGFDFFHISNSLTSFPSGHSATALGAAAAFALLIPRYRILFFLFGVAIMISRVVIVRHYPSDIMIGGLIGALTSYLLYERYFKEKIEKEEKR